MPFASPISSARLQRTVDHWEEDNINSVLSVFISDVTLSALVRNEFYIGLCNYMRAYQPITLISLLRQKVLGWCLIIDKFISFMNVSIFKLLCLTGLNIFLVIGAVLSLRYICNMYDDLSPIFNFFN
jgi:hypothetical protein